MIPFYIQNDNAAAKVTQLRQQKALAAEEARRRMELLNQSSRDTSGTHSNDSEAFGRSRDIVLCCTCFERFEERIAYMADVLQWSEEQGSKEQGARNKEHGRSLLHRLRV